MLSVLTGGLAAAQFGAVGRAMASTNDLCFLASRNGSEVGKHIVRFQRDGGTLLASSTAEFVIRFGPIVFYRYSYAATETWQDGVLQRLSARTDNDGKAEFAELQRFGDRLVVSGSKSGRYTAPQGAIAATHWNPAELGQPMINPQNGELMQFAHRDLGYDRLPSGALAKHFALSGYATLDLWYDDTPTWRALRGVLPDGSIMEYHAA